MIEGAAGHLIVVRDGIDRKLASLEEERRGLIKKLEKLDGAILDARNDRAEVVDGINILRGVRNGQGQANQGISQGSQGRF